MSSTEGKGVHEELVTVCKVEDRVGKCGTGGRDGILGNHGMAVLSGK